MKVALYTLHYGKEYLAWSIRSIQDAVDEIIVLYSKTPSFGHKISDLICPDTEEELYTEANRFLIDKSKLKWISGNWGSEGVHREEGLTIARNAHAEIAVVVDADEIWHKETLVNCFNEIQINQKGTAGRWTANFCNFWKSFNHVMIDWFIPIRIIDFTSNFAEQAHMTFQEHPVYHFGYAQSESIMKYKWTVHGHQSELLDGWMDKFLNWTETSQEKWFHPASRQLWEYPVAITPTDKKNVEGLLFDHPYKDLIIIK